MQISTNPLSIVFGLTLKYWRQKADEKGSGDLVELLNLKDNYWRRLERGVANMHVSRTLNLAQVVQELVNPNINYHKLARFMIALQCVQWELSRVDIKKALDTIKEEESTLSVVIDDLLGIIDEVEKKSDIAVSKNNKKFNAEKELRAQIKRQETILVQSLEKYLEEEIISINTSKSSNRSIDEKLRKLPSYIAPFTYRSIIDLNSSVLKFIPKSSIDITEAQKFEIEHIDSIEKMFFAFKEDELHNVFIPNKDGIYNFPVLGKYSFIEYNFLIISNNPEHCLKVIQDQFTYKTLKNNKGQYELEIAQEVHSGDKKASTFLEALALKKYGSSKIPHSKIRPEIEKLRFYIISDSDINIPKYNSLISVFNKKINEQENLPNWVWAYELIDKGKRYYPYNSIGSYSYYNQLKELKAYFLDTEKTQEVAQAMRELTKLDGYALMAEIPTKEEAVFKPQEWHLGFYLVKTSLK